MPNTPLMLDEYGADISQIARRRKLADMLQSQSMQPIENQQTGRFATPISPFQGAAKMAQAYVAAMGGRQADEQERELGTQMQGRRSSLLAKAMSQAQGTPARMDEDAAGNAWGTPAQAGDTRGAMQTLAGGSDPMLAQLGTQQLMSQMTPQYKYQDMGGYIAVIDGRTNQIVSQLPKSATPDAQLSQAGQDRRHVTPSGSVLHTEQGAAQRHLTPSGSANLSAVVSREGHGVATRGQDLNDVRQRDANAIAQGNRTAQNTEDVRKEFNALPEVKNYKEVIPIIASAQRAPNTPAGDIDLIYAVGKIMDPNSVVREGELALVIKSGSPAQRFQGLVSYVQGGGRLTPAQRTELTQVLNSRVQALQTSYDAAKTAYTGMVTRQGLDPRQVFADLPSGVITNPGANQPFAYPANSARVVSWNDLGR